ncbi:MAG: hypothetical protein LBK00_03670 [Treponema sp.]|jgi:hypothetical protein|nr:hypothetical protein [Treponema sp.]
MKKVVALLMIMAMYSTTMFADPLPVTGDGLVYTGSSPPEQDPSQLILRIDNVFSFYDYQSFDGTSLKYKDVTSLVKTIPENQPLLSRITGVRIANWSFAAVLFASAITAWTYSFVPDLPHAETMFNVALLTGMFALLGEMITYQWHEDLFQRAVDNYNLSIMGIPVPTKK